MKALVPPLVAALIAGFAFAQEVEAPPPGSAAGAASEGTDTEEPEETGAAAHEESVIPDEGQATRGASVLPPPTQAPYAPAPPTSYNPSRAYVPQSAGPLDPETRLPPTSFNPSGVYAPPTFYERPVWPQNTTPVFIDQLGKSPEAPPSWAEAAYESRLRASFLSAQGMQGPLEGSWVIAATNGGQLYHLQLVDAFGGSIDGAWRDLRRPGAIDSSGLIVGAQRIGSQFTVRFYPPGAREAVVANLTATLDGRWTGELSEHGRRQSVVLRRN